eukprot:scaffold57650_cov38-Prasinocladus_malaysianus.AAC.2
MYQYLPNCRGLCLYSPALQAQEANSGPKAEPSQPKPMPGGPAPPPGFPPDLPAPEPLNSADAAMADPLMDIIGEYTATCLFSKNWQLREAGMQMVEKYLTEGKLPKGDKKDELRQLTRLICKAVKDKVANVFQGGMNNMRTLLDTYGQHVGARDLVHASSEFVTVLFEKLADNNARTQAAAQEGILFLAAIPGVDAVIAPQQFLLTIDIHLCSKEGNDGILSICGLCLFICQGVQASQVSDCLEAGVGATQPAAAAVGAVWGVRQGWGRRPPTGWLHEIRRGCAQFAKRRRPLGCSEGTHTFVVLFQGSRERLSLLPLG